MTASYRSDRRSGGAMVVPLSLRPLLLLLLPLLPLLLLPAPADDVADTNLRMSRCRAEAAPRTAAASAAADSAPLACESTKLSSPERSDVAGPQLLQLPLRLGKFNFSEGGDRACRCSAAPLSLLVLRIVSPVVGRGCVSAAAAAAAPPSACVSGCTTGMLSPRLESCWVSAEVEVVVVVSRNEDASWPPPPFTTSCSVGDAPR